MDAKTICQINDNLKNTRSLWDTLWQDVADYIVMRKASVIGTMTPGSKLTQKMYMSLPTQLGQDLAAWISYNLTSGEWFFLKMGGLLKDVKEFNEWLEECRRIQYEAIRDSNFSGQWNEVLLDMINFCTGAFYVEENEVERPGFNGLNFISLSPGTYCILLGKDGRTKCLFRELKMQANECTEKWGEKCSDDIKKAAEKDPSKEWDFIHAVMPQSYFGGKHRIKSKPFVSYYVDVKNKLIMQEGGYYWFPYFVIPYLRESGEDYGRGPGITALPDVKTGHKARELSLKEWALSIWPPLRQIENGVIGSVKLTPGGLTTVARQGAEKNLEPLLTGANYAQNRQRFEDLKNDIREVFHADKVKFIPPRDQTGQMTAYEVARRYELAHTLLGPTFGNIVDHGFDPMIECTFAIMQEAGAFPPMPPALAELMDRNAGRVTIEYESPLARQKRLQEVNAINDTHQAVGSLVELKPDIMDVFKLDDAAKHIARSIGYPEKFIREDEESKEIRKARATIQQQQRQIEQLTQIAKAAKDGAGAAAELPEGTL